MQGGANSNAAALENPKALMTDRPTADELAVNALITQTKAKQGSTEPG